MNTTPITRPAFLFATALVFSMFAATAAQAAPADRVVLISWDGVRRDVLHELLEYQPLGETPKPCPNSNRAAAMPTPCGAWLTCMPNLCRFQVVDSNVLEGKALTRPQHAQMLTGYGPPETGDITNSGVHAVPPGLTIYERLQAARPEILTVHLAGLKFIGRGVVGNAMSVGALGLLLKRGARDQYTGNNTTQQVVVGLDYIGDFPYFLFFIHYKAADVVCHRAGDASPAYREAIIANDFQLGTVLDILAGRSLLDGTKVYLTTDHGFDGVFHINREVPSISETWFASRTFDLTPGPATVLDVTPTVLDAFGVDTSTAEPPYRGVSRIQH